PGPSPTPAMYALSLHDALPILGGTGVVTIGQLLGMAAHLEGKGGSVLDMAGLAQKGGAVFSHVVLAERPDAILNTRVAMGEADLDRKSTRLNSSHVKISYAVFC